MVLRPQLVHRSMWNLLDIAGTILQLQSTMELHRQLPPPAPLAMPFALRERSYSCKSQWNSICNSSTSTTCNSIYIAGTILQLQITMEVCRPHMHEKQLKPHLQCGTDSERDPTMIRDRSDHDPTTHETVSQPSHRRGRSSRFGDGLCMEKHRVSCICYLSKTHFVRDFLQNSIGNSSTSTTCNAIYSEGTILELQITMEFHRQLIHQHHLQSHFHSRERSYSLANHNGIPCATHPPACTCNSIYIAWTILQLQITLMEFCRPPMHETQVTPHLQCGTDPTMIRDRSDHDPTTHETVSQPSHRRGRSSRFGDGLCMEKHRVSCICYLSKNAFRARLPPKLHRQLLHQHHLQSHLQWGNDPRVANHNGIPSATHPPAPLAMPFTLRERSYSLQITMEFCRPHMHEKQLKPHLQCGTDPSVIRPWSETDPTMIRPHTRPSRNRRTAEVDHRGSGTDFVWKNILQSIFRIIIGFRASAISQKRISCETSSKTPSATPPPAPLAMPFTVREQFLC